MKVWNYIFLLTGLILLFEIAGVPTGASAILTVVGLGTGSVSVSVSSIYDAIFSIGGILGGLGAGIFIGFFTKSSPENYVILPIIGGTFAFFVQSFLSIINYALANFDPWLYSIVLIILAPLSVLYLVALVEFFRGSD